MNQGRNNQGQRPANKQSVQNGRPYTERWVRIRSIKNGIITLPNRDMVTGVKVEPRNIFIMEQIQQDNILNALKNCYNTFNFEFWLIAADRPVDISVYRSQLELKLNEENDPAIRKLLVQDLEKAEMFVNNQVVDTEYYLLFKENNIDMLNQKVRTMIDGFASCSMLASQTTDEDLRVILDNFLNGGVRTDFGTVVLK
ncbi:MAG: hypothetical protein IJO27_04405 [Bacilli bacterium]|nr:hypothetical protein [Bacilli bacterium]